MSFHGGHVNDNSFFITEKSENVQVDNYPDYNGIGLKVDNLGAGFKSDHFEYKIAFIKAKGSVEVSMSQVKLGVTIGLTTQTLSDGKNVPAFTV